MQCSYPVISSLTHTAILHARVKELYNLKNASTVISNIRVSKFSNFLRKKNLKTLSPRTNLHKGIALALVVSKKERKNVYKREEISYSPLCLRFIIRIYIHAKAGNTFFCEKLVLNL